MRDCFVSELSIIVFTVEEVFISIERCFKHITRIVRKIRNFMRMSLEHCKSKFNVFIATKIRYFKVISVFSKPNKFLFIIRSQYWVLLRTFGYQLTIIGNSWGCG